MYDIIRHYEISLEDVLPRLRRFFEGNDRVVIAILARPPLELRELLLLSARLEEELHIPVDVAPLDDVNSGVAYRALIDGVKIVVRDPSLYNNLVKKLIAEVEDLDMKQRILEPR